MRRLSGINLNLKFWILDFGSIAFLLALNGWGLNCLAVAQVIPDATLPNNSRVTPAGNVFMIDGGTAAGSNLFHSFAEFSLPTGTEAFFNNSGDISNIISRVTGGKVSDLDGLIRANGKANLFLINPSGIIFGPNAALNIGGSFLASTANGVRFNDGSIFSANNPNSPPLLSVNLPVGLQYGSNANGITVQQSRLQVAPNQSLSLFGGNVSVNGGNLLASGGRISLGGLIGEGVIGIAGINLSFPVPVQRGDISIANNSKLDVTGNNGGDINFYGNNIQVSGASQVLAGIAANGGGSNAIAGDILLNATGDITIGDKSAIANAVRSGSSGNGGNIEITSNNFALTSGARITTVTQATGNAGNIRINANNIDITGFSSDGLFSGILSYSETADSGTAGNIAIDRGTLHLANRGFIATVTNSSSNGGAIELNLTDLVVESGGQIVTLATNSGDAGNIIVNATGKVSISGNSNDFIASPFEGILVYNLNDLPLSNDVNPNVEASGTIPYLSVQRTPDRIINGNTVLGTADEQYDYYGFTITSPNSRAIFDIDGGNGYSPNPGSIDTEITLFNRATGEVIANNDDSNIKSGAGGSTAIEDSYISTTLNPGNYVIGVGEFDTVPDNVQLLEGDRVDPGDTYTLNISLENRGTGNSTSNNNINPNNFNPNYGAKSGIFSGNRGAGNTGEITINTGNLVMQHGSEIAALASGNGTGRNININGVRSVEINDARISNITRGAGNSGNISINTENLLISNLGLLNLSNFRQGNTGDININSLNTNLSGGSQLNNSTYVRGNAGRITIKAGDTVTFQGTGTAAYNLVAGPSAVGNSGGISIDSRVLLVTDGGQISTSSYGVGSAGNIDVNVRDRISLDGRNTSGRGSNFLTRVRARGRGTAGNINISTNALSVTNGASINSQTQGIGNAGNININAAETFLDLGAIATNVDPTAVGNGGSINFNSTSILLTNQSQISANTSGSGDGGQIALTAFGPISLNNSVITTSSEANGIGGSIKLQASSLTLDNKSSITAATFANQGGEILLSLSDRLLLRDNSQITATAGISGAGGDGGNISISTSLIATFPRENNDITANAFEGKGGNIQLTAKGILGIDFRSGETFLSDITASSQFGVSGNVTITNPQVNPASGLVPLPTEITDNSNRIVVSCAAVEGNSFTITGRGGLPENPTNTIRGQTVWQDLQDFSTMSLPSRQQSSIGQNNVSRIVDATPLLIEANSWQIDASGKVALVSDRLQTIVDRTGEKCK